MKAELRLNTKNAEEEITDLYNFINEHSLSGIKNRIIESEPEKGTMGAGELMPIIQIVLGSTVVAAGVKSLFDILKSYFELRKQKSSAQIEIEKNKTDQHKIEFAVETNDGKKINLKFSSFNDDERKQFFETVDKVFSN